MTKKKMLKNFTVPAEIPHITDRLVIRGNLSWDGEIFQKIMFFVIEKSFFFVDFFEYEDGYLRTDIRGVYWGFPVIPNF